MTSLVTYNYNVVEQTQMVEKPLTVLKICSHKNSLYKVKRRPLSKIFKEI